MQKNEKNPEVIVLEEKLAASRTDPEAVKNIFLDHLHSGYIERYLQTEAERQSLNPDYLVKNVIGQTNINFFNNDYFDYSIQLRSPSQVMPGSTKWMGTSQFIRVKGNGFLDMRVLEVPKVIDICSFQKDIQVKVIEERQLHGGDIVCCQGPNRILDVVRVHSAVIIESLVIKNTATNIFWSFNEQGNSFMAESSNVNRSRLVNILNLAATLDRGVPPGLYAGIFAEGDYNVQLKAIQMMLGSGDIKAFDYIQESIDSPNTLLSEGAQRILDRLVSNELETTTT